MPSNEYTLIARVRYSAIKEQADFILLTPTLQQHQFALHKIDVATAPNLKKVFVIMPPVGELCRRAKQLYERTHTESVTAGRFKIDERTAQQLLDLRDDPEFWELTFLMPRK